MISKSFISPQSAKLSMNGYDLVVWLYSLYKWAFSYDKSKGTEQNNQKSKSEAMGDTAKVLKE